MAGWIAKEMPFMKRLCSLILIAALCIVVTTGCSRSAAVAPVTMVAEQGTNAAGKMLTAYLVTWDIQRGTLVLSDTPLFHRSYYSNDWPRMLWSSGPPFTVLQRSVDQVQGGVKQQLLMVQPAASDTMVLTWPATLALNIKAQESVSWYAWDKKVFMSAPLEMIISPYNYKTLAGKSVQITQYTAPVETLAAVLPSELQSIQGVYTIYGSGSLENGFVLVETRTAGAAVDVFWLIRLSGGKATWLPCGDAPCGGVVSGAGPQFVRIDSRLYLLGGCRDKIAMIDTAAAKPVITYPTGINRTFSSLITKAGKDTVTGAPFSAALEGSGTVLQLSLFNWTLNAEQTYALNEDGTILGYLDGDTSGRLWCMDARGRRLSSLSLPNVQYSSSPSPDLFAGW
jgi:hypothetical protein